MKSFLQGILLLASLIITTATMAQTPPRAYDVDIQGALHVKSVLSGIYSYSDTNNRPEGNSIYRWYRADSINQPDPQLIDSAFTIAYQTDTIDNKKYIAFEVTPVASGTGDSLTGTPVRVWTDHVISIVGIQERYLQLAVYPNPAVSEIRIINGSRISNAEFYSTKGKMVLTTTSAGTAIDISSLSPGIYILKAVFTDGSAGRTRIVKL